MQGHESCLTLDIDKIVLKFLCDIIVLNTVLEIRHIYTSQYHFLPIKH